VTEGIRFGRVRAGAIMMHHARGGVGAPLVLLHGWPEFWLVWRRLMTRLAGRFDLIAPEWRGFGDSDKPDPGPAADTTPDQLAEDLRAFLDGLGLPRVGLVAHDVGSAAAQVFARAWPERVSGLFLFNAVHAAIGRGWIDGGHYARLWYQGFNQQAWAAQLVGSSREACRLYIGGMLAAWSRDPGAFDDDLEAFVDNFMKPGNLQGGFNWYLSVQPWRLAAIEGTAPKPPPLAAVPARVLWGRHDPVLLPAWAEGLRRFFPDIEIGYAEDAGHFVHHESPDEAVAAVAEFFSGPRVRWA
jgi:pimeloyl-ACP methyl ester carboxylesterase